MNIKIVLLSAVLAVFSLLLICEPVNSDSSISFGILKPISKILTVSNDTCQNFKPSYYLSDYERSVVEAIVMGEAGGESYEGKLLVAQCIYNACVTDGLIPSEVRRHYQYSGWNSNVSKEVKQAVSDVFDFGKLLVDEPILYFYSPKYCSSKWHESLCFVIEEGNHRFFKKWS